MKIQSNSLGRRIGYPPGFSFDRINSNKEQLNVKTNVNNSDSFSRNSERFGAKIQTERVDSVTSRSGKLKLHNNMNTFGLYGKNYPNRPSKLQFCVNDPHQTLYTINRQDPEIDVTLLETCNQAANGKPAPLIVVRTKNLVYLLLPGAQLNIPGKILIDPARDIQSQNYRIPLEELSTTPPKTIEPLKEAVREQVRNMNAVITLRGASTRMYGLSGKITGFTKTWLPIGDEPLAYKTLRTLINPEIGMQRVILTTFYEWSAVENTIQHTPSREGEPSFHYFGVQDSEIEKGKLKITEQQVPWMMCLRGNQQMGPAGPYVKLLQWAKCGEISSSTFDPTQSTLWIHGDCLFPDLAGLLQAHFDPPKNQKTHDVTLMVRPLPKGASETISGVLEVENATNKIVDFCEKPKPGEKWFDDPPRGHHFAQSIGARILSPSFAKAVLDSPPEQHSLLSSDFSLETCFFPQFIKEGTLNFYAYEAPNYHDWVDCGNPESYLAALTNMARHPDHYPPDMRIPNNMGDYFLNSGTYPVYCPGNAKQLIANEEAEVVGPAIVLKPALPT